MKQTITIIIVILITLALWLPSLWARADIQPNEQYNDNRCHAAVQASDQGAIRVYCMESAEDHITDAYDESGPTKAFDLIYAARNLVICGLSHSMSYDNDGTGPGLYQSAVHLLQEARQYANAKQLREIDYEFTQDPLSNYQP